MIEWIERYRLPAPASSVPGRLLPIVADTYDGSWDDINGFHVRESHACAAVERATPGRCRRQCGGGGASQARPPPFKAG